MPGRFTSLLSHPVALRLAWYGRRVREQLNRRMVLAVVQIIVVVVVVAAALVTLVERQLTLGDFGESLYWAFTSILGAGEGSYVGTPAGWIIRTVLVIVSVFMAAIITATIIAVIVDFLLKEGQGLGASGFAGHIVICGWNTTAKFLIKELRSDDYRLRVVLIHGAERNPAGDGVYFVRGDPTDTADLERANIRAAEAAIVFPAEPTDEADMRSILAIMAIEAAAPNVRIVAEVNNPRHVEHFLRARADEVLATSRVASHLLARSALYPGLTTLVTDIVSGGEGSELYRVTLPDSYVGLSVDEVSSRLRRDHRATLLAISRGEATHVNPEADFVLLPSDDVLVVAESLGSLAPLRLARHRPAPTSPPPPFVAERAEA